MRQGLGLGTCNLPNAMMLLLSVYVDVAAMLLRQLLLLLLLLVGRMFVIILASSAGSFSAPSSGCEPLRVLLAKMSQFVNQSVCQSLVYNGQALRSLLLLRLRSFMGPVPYQLARGTGYCLWYGAYEQQNEKSK